MHHRRSSAIAAGLLLLAAPVLSSCGFDAATNRVNTISTGVNDRAGEIDVLGAVIVAGADNAGLLVGTLANNSTEEGDTLSAVAGAVSPVDFSPVDVPATGAADLFDLGGISVTGEFTVGQFVSVNMSFDGGQSTTINVPVVKPCYQYDPAKFDPPLELPGVTDSTPTADAETESAVGTEPADQPGPYSCEIERSDRGDGGEVG